ncbi:hypothetical protein Tco_1494273 [Tanacetum coccineum]
MKTNFSFDYRRPPSVLHVREKYLTTIREPFIKLLDDLVKDLLFGVVDNLIYSHSEAPLSLVPAPEYPEYLAPSDDDIPAENWPLPVDASPTAHSPGYIADSEPIEDDSEDDPEMDLVDYPSDEEEEEPSASTDLASPVPDSVPSSEETEPFRTDESAIEARIAEYGSAPTPPLPPPSPLTSLSSPLPQILSPQFLLSSPTCRDMISEADMPPWKRARFTAPSQRFEIGESSAAAIAR